eukprot:4049508-Amphidinium_carterae.1
MLEEEELRNVTLLVLANKQENRNLYYQQRNFQRTPLPPESVKPWLRKTIGKKARNTRTTLNKLFFQVVRVPHFSCMFCIILPQGFGRE